MKLVELLRNPEFDWPTVNVLAGKPTLWMAPMVSGQAFDTQQIAMQPMYPLRKLLAQSRRCYTSALPAEILNALLAIEAGQPHYYWAFANMHDAWKMARKWQDPRNQIPNRPRNLLEHKLSQLFGCFPNQIPTADVQLALFIGTGICDHPGLHRTGGPGRIETERPDLIPRKHWDLTGFLDFMGGVWLIERHEAQNPVIITLEQFRALWEPCAPPSITFERDFNVREFRNVLANWVEDQS